MAKRVYLEELKVRLHKLQMNGKNVDSPGVVNKLQRKIRSLEGAQSKQACGLVAQWWSNRLLTDRLQVQVLPIPAMHWFTFVNWDKKPSSLIV